MPENVINLVEFPATEDYLYSAIEKAISIDPTPQVIVPFSCFLLNQISRRIAFGKSKVSFSLERIQSILNRAADSTIYYSRADYRICDISNPWASLSEKFHEVLEKEKLALPEQFQGTQVRLFIPGTMFYPREINIQSQQKESFQSQTINSLNKDEKDITALLREWKERLNNTIPAGETYKRLVCSPEQISDAIKWRTQKNGCFVGVQPHADTMILAYVLSRLLIPQILNREASSNVTPLKPPLTYSMAAECNHPSKWGDFHFIPFSHFGFIPGFPLPDIMICNRSLLKTEFGQFESEYFLAEIDSKSPEDLVSQRNERSLLGSLYRNILPFETLDDSTPSLADKFHLPIAWSLTNEVKPKNNNRFSMIGGYADQRVNVVNNSGDKELIEFYRNDLFIEGLAKAFSYEEQRILLWYFSRIELKSRLYMIPTSDGYSWSIDSGICLESNHHYQFPRLSRDIHRYRFLGAKEHQSNQDPLCVAVRKKQKTVDNYYAFTHYSEEIAKKLAKLCGLFREKFGRYLDTDNLEKKHLPISPRYNVIETLRSKVLRFYSGTHGVRSGILHSMTPEALIGNIAFPNSFYRREPLWTKLLIQVLGTQSIDTEKTTGSSKQVITKNRMHQSLK